MGCRVTWLFLIVAWIAGCGSSTSGTTIKGADAAEQEPPPAGEEDGGEQDAEEDLEPDAGETDGGEGGTSAGGRWVMGYYSIWNARSYPVGEIDWNALTHIATAFNLPDGNGGVSASGSFDPMLARSVVSAAHEAGRKAIASIGGVDSARVFEGSTSPANLDTFVNNLRNLVTNIGYDGVDLDWEGGPPTDQALLMSLVQALRTAMPGILITLPVAVENNNFKTNLSFYAAVTPLVDQINIMTYNVSGAFPGWKSWHSSPLHWNRDNATPVAIDITVADYLRANVPPSKLGIGSGFFGECYSAPVTAPSQMLQGSTVVATDGVMSYEHLVASYDTANARKWDAIATVPYLSFASPQGPEMCTYITYEDAESIAAKAEWVKSNGLGGIILWTINEGFIAGAPPGQRNPLLAAVGAAFLR
jgi:chitinase